MHRAHPNVRLLVAGFLAAVVLLGAGVAVGSALSGERSAPAYSGPSGFADGADGEQAVVWAVGDGADGSEIAVEVAELVPEDADQFLYLGDVYDWGTAEDFNVDAANDDGG